MINWEAYRNPRRKRRENKRLGLQIPEIDTWGYDRGRVIGIHEGTIESDIGAAQSEIVFYEHIRKSVFGLNLTNIALVASRKSIKSSPQKSSCHRNEPCARRLVTTDHTKKGKKKEEER